MISFGPIPSRRLGKSLGINNIPGRKICSYSCIYCQVGKTNEYRTICEPFFEPDVIFAEVKAHLKKLNERDKPDYLTFVANGEPTLDVNLGKSITLLKSLGIPIAVITNASLMNNKQVRDNLALADWVSVKVDSANEKTWKRINRPSTDIEFNDYLQGVHVFSREYKGKLVCETMLVKDVNDSEDNLKATAELISRIHPSVTYISVPTRPPAMHSVAIPSEDSINTAFQIYSGKGLNVELLLGFEGTHTGFTGNIIEDILNICAVHPIREDTMQELLIKDNSDYTLVDSLVHNKQIRIVEYKSMKFYIRQLTK